MRTQGFAEKKSLDQVGGDVADDNNYVVEITDGGGELVDALVSIARGVCPTYRCRKAPGRGKNQQVRLADQLKALEMLLDAGFRQVATAARHSP